MTSLFRIHRQAIPPKHINVVYPKPKPDCLQQMKAHETVQQTAEKHFDKGWRYEVTIADKYKEQFPKLWELLK